MKRFSLLSMGALALISLAPPAAHADEYDKKTIVTISAPTEVPGIILQPGTYVIKLLNSSSNRHIAEIMNERMDHLYALTFTAAAEKIDRSGKTVLTFYEGSAGRPQALRKWFWPGDTIGQEFIYPKNQAARISAATGQKVPEGNLPTLAESGQSLNPDNAKGLDLDEKVEVSEKTSVTETPAPLIARAAEPEPPVEPAPVVAQNTPPPAPVEPQRVEETRQPEPAPAPVSTPRESASVDTSTTTLPQTASPLPLIGVIGIGSLALALCVGFMRRQRSARGL
ncbi:MAG: hypothetical protein JWO19_4771 [Bryobacterales bacterium]|nr:hypothetical protein [Bryobacterales bacterium]